MNAEGDREGADDTGPDPVWTVFDRAWSGTELLLHLATGHRAGLLDAVVAGPGRAEEIAARAGTDPRMSLEWCRAMTVGGLLDAEGDVFSARDGLDQLVNLADVDSPVDILATLVDGLPRRQAALVEALRSGKGVDPEVHRPAQARLQHLSQTVALAPLLVEHVIAPVDGLPADLTAGCDVVDVGCGGGWALTALAERFPRSRYLGLDLDETALAIARSGDPVRSGRVSVRRQDVLDLAPASADVVLLVEVLHDLPDPVAALGAVRAALRPGGVVVVAEADATGDFALDRHSAVAGQYAASFAGCVPVSQHAGGPGLGALWGRSAAVRALEEAGLRPVTVHTSPTGHVVLPCRTPGDQRDSSARRVVT